MKENQSDGNENGRSRGTFPSFVNRRSVLRGAATLGLAGLGTSVAGYGVADEHEEEDEDDDSDSEDGSNGSESADEALPIGIQMWTLRSLFEDETVPDVIRRVGEAGYDGVEPFTVGDSHPCDLLAAIEDYDLDVPGGHTGLENLEDNFEETVETHTMYGADQFVVAYLGPEYFEDAASVEETAQRLNDVADRLDEHELNLSYHNHDHEFVEVDGQPALDTLVEETNDNVDIQLDIGWVAAAGYDPVSVIDRYGERIDSLHVKDMHLDGDEADFATMGEGDVDIEAAISAAHDVEREVYLIFENDEPDDPVAELENGVNTISEIQDSLLSD